MRRAIRFSNFKSNKKELNSYEDSIIFSKSLMWIHCAVKFSDRNLIIISLFTINCNGRFVIENDEFSSY